MSGFPHESHMRDGFTQRSVTWPREGGRQSYTDRGGHIDRGSHENHLPSSALFGQGFVPYDRCPLERDYHGFHDPEDEQYNRDVDHQDEPQLVQPRGTGQGKWFQKQETHRLSGESLIVQSIHYALLLLLLDHQNNPLV